ncbi:LytTr DNA-binding domain-containing protein [Cohnella sp. OV330]|uniref:LytTR family DNA-binding domain-containing protein n=1 Tax=Cohnella sp. OV330 TaxID=1855288 RepID=UPI0008EEBF50|nr:LytTR family DNA-binding domain-containing protein [Cohnella sp. OV330]SFA91180.1 LytTr DNA-binding domain-containing protein [Cohnella sp. OV330]
MLYLAVTEDLEGKSGYINIAADDVLYLEFDMFEKMVHVHTADSKYYIAGTLLYCTESLKSAGYQFERVDRSCVVNVPKIRRMDKTFYLAYFEDEIGPKSKKVTMSQKLFKEVFNVVKASQKPAII